MNKSLRRRIALIVFLATVVFGIQMVKIQRPFFGHFASYQAVSAFVSRNMIKERFSEPLLPKTDFMIGKKRSLPLNQYPFQSVIAALGSFYAGGSLEFWGRFQAIVFNAGSVILTGMIAYLLLGSSVGWIAAVMMCFSPFALIYGQMFMSEAGSLFFLLLSLFWVLSQYLRHEKTKRGILFLAAVSFSVALVGRIHYLVFLPVIWIVIQTSRQSNRTKLMTIALFTFIAVLLPFLWFFYTYVISLRADNVHSNLFLQLGGRRFADSRYLLDPNYYRHVFDIFSEKMFTPLIFPFFCLGAIFLGTQISERRNFAILGANVILGVLIIIFFPQKVLDHEFYLYGMMPFCLIIAAYGVSRVMEMFSVLQQSKVVTFLLLLYLVVSARYFLHPIYKYPDEKRNLLPVANLLRAKTMPTDWLVIASYGYSELVYYADRPSWSIDFSSLGHKLPYYFKNPKFSNLNFRKMSYLEEAMKDPISWLEYLKSEGASYLVVPNEKDLDLVPDFRFYIERNYIPIPLAPHSLLFRLSDRAVLPQSGDSNSAVTTSKGD